MKHKNGKDCACPTCLMADMDKHLVSVGQNPAKFGTIVVTGERTGYRAPGQGAGTGVVRKVSPGQVAYMETLFEGKDLTNLVRLRGSEDFRNMSLAGARDLIDRLLALPWKPGYPKEKAASPKQVEWIKRLGQEKVLTDDIEMIVKAALSGMFVSASDAKVALDYLFKAEHAVSVRQTTPRAPMEPGMYETPDGTIYKVQRGRQTKILYAMRADLIDGNMSFTFESGAMHKLNSDMRMSVERAEKLSIEFGCCIRCSATLTRKDSIAAGIGPICRGKV